MRAYLQDGYWLDGVIRQYPEDRWAKFLWAFGYVTTPVYR